jgi:2-aminoethylphosphonate-pyruvate transaminase
MQKMGFAALLNQENQSPIITSFLYPKDTSFTFAGFYEALKQKGFVIYPGKISKLDTFRIGNIGEVYPNDIDQLLAAIKETSSEEAVKL